jgi:peptide/nickel transport system substrate-binding protein
VKQGAVDQALILQREAAKIGLKIDVKRVTTDGYWSSVWLKEPLFVGAWNMRPTANAMLSLAYQSEASWNESRFKNKHFDDALVKVRSVTDPVVRSQMYCDLQTMIHEEAGTIIPSHINFVDAVASHVKGLTYVPLNSFGGGEAAEFLWRDDT